MANIKTIGKGSVLTDKDAEWLKRLADEIYGDGRYMKGNYLHALVENAETKTTRPPTREEGGK